MTVPNRAWGLLLVAALALPGAGCLVLDALNIRYSDTGAGRDRVVTGSVDVVAQKTAARMNELGFATEIRTDPQTQAVRVLCTGGGAKFALVLTREMKEVGEQTRLRLEWDGPANDPAGAKILGALDVLTR